MNRLILPLLIAATVAVLAAGVLHPIRPPPAPRTQTLTLEQIQPLASLLTTRVQFADVVVERIDGYAGTLRLAAVIKGDVLIRIDLAEARLEQVDEEARTAVLVLPQPQILSPRVDHADSRVVLVHTTGLWHLLPTDAGRGELFDAAMRRAQRRIAGAADDQALIDEARQRAEQLITTFAEDTLGWHLTPPPSPPPSPKSPAGTPSNPD